MCAYLFVYIGWTSVYLYVMAPLALYLDEDVQLKVLVPNLLVGAANVNTGRETVLDTQRRLSLIHNLRLCCKAWKMIVNKSVEYNALRLAQHEYCMGRIGVLRVCLIREHNLIHQFQMNSFWFSHSRHVTSKIPTRILISDLGDLSLSSLAKLKDELENCWCAGEMYGIIFE